METTKTADLAAHWEAHYGATDRVWSGRPNQTLVEVVSGLDAGRALDLGCGEGGDAIWLAGRGWQVTGVDVSSVAIERARAAALGAEVADRVEWAVADLGSWTGEGSYDLVTACFFHSPVEPDRAGALRRAAALVASGGRMLIISHAGAPSWSNHHDHADYRFRSPAEEVEDLRLEPGDWTVELSETRQRAVTDPQGQPATLDDAVVLLRRT
ncbi:class I SAM-dependent methyltransferase [Microlunatus sp. GCM10028923]|uniref:class I SAM-dependent methyltransferase n=1 Tax=Microlunatus sp. GCM10028923 TaxID=3273400 RepID=UPI00361E03B1